MWLPNVFRAILVILCCVGLNAWVVAHPKSEPDKAAATPSPAAGTANSKAGAAAGETSAKTPPPPAPPHFPQIDALRKNAVKGEPQDEALGGKTLHGTPVMPRTAECFPAESRDLFWQMDRVPDGPNDELRSLNFDKNNSGKLEDVSPFRPHPDNERDAIRGRNTWILWAGGNEGFWNWLAQDGYGLTDLLVAFDSRSRGSRFKRLGVMNQPGFIANADPAKRLLGLYLDLPAADPNGPKMEPAPWDKGHERATRPADHHGFKLFEPADSEEYQKALSALTAMEDGVAPDIYGYPTGVVGARLFLNPDYFADTEAAKQARKYWEDRVINTNDRFYSDPTISADSKLVRPFRIGMSCGFCHVGPHPLNPPVDPESPKWENLSSIIGNQFWKPQPLFANRTAPNSFIYHFLASQQPGTIDTSLISTDQINNSNTINAVFEVTARLERAGLRPPAGQTPNPPEKQSNANLRLLSIEDQQPGFTDPAQIDERRRQRHTARILLDGSDSIGAFGALARVYLNIGTFYEEWNTCHNPIIGFRPQRAFALETCQRNSVYWQANEKYRAPYLAAFFTLTHTPSKPAAADDAAAAPPPAADAAAVPVAVGYHDATQAMHLKVAKNGAGEPSVAAQSVFKLDTTEQRRNGRNVWLRHCAICHSSKQPAGFELSFARAQAGTSWRTMAAPKGNQYTLPSDFMDWEDFKTSPAYEFYQSELHKLVVDKQDLNGDPLDDKHEFWTRNYLSTDIRVPLTLVGTNPARGLGTNALKGHVWDNFSSDTYKELPAVGRLIYTDVVGRKVASIQAPDGGRGYYRPATHVSLWSTAPFLHNNAMGLYLDDPSVKGRLVQFLDSIRRMLWFDRRASKSLVLSKAEMDWFTKTDTDDAKRSLDPNMIVERPGDLRATDPKIAGEDPGFVYRVPQQTNFEIPVGYTRELIEGAAGTVLTSILAVWLWVFAVIALLVLAKIDRVRYVGVGLVVLSAILVALLVQNGVGGNWRAVAGVILMGIMDWLQFTPVTWGLLVLGLGGVGFLLILADPNCSRFVRWAVAAAALLLVIAVALLEGPVFVTLLVAALVTGIVWVWKPTLARLTRATLVFLALLTVLIGLGANRFINGEKLITVPVANVTVGPFAVKLGPIPRGVPVNLLMNIDPESKHFARAAAALTVALVEIRTKHLEGSAAYDTFMATAGPALIDASKCPDFQLDRGHLFGEALSDEEKEDLIAFLKTL